MRALGPLEDISYHEQNKVKDTHLIRMKMVNKRYPSMVGFQRLKSRLVAKMIRGPKPKI